MTICPKCNQMSSSDKICSNCWANLTIKPKGEKKSADAVEQRLKNMVIWAGILIVVLFLMSMVLETFKSGDSGGVGAIHSAPAQQVTVQPVQSPTPTATQPPQ